MVTHRHERAGLPAARAAVVAKRGRRGLGQPHSQEAMDALCAAQESVLERLERAGIQGELGPRLAEPRDPAYWLSEPGGGQ